MASHHAGGNKADQIYFLYRLTQNQLKQVAFPLGGMTKPEVRDHTDASVRTLADGTSQEICFVGQRGLRSDSRKDSGRGRRER